MTNQPNAITNDLEALQAQTAGMLQVFEAVNRHEMPPALQDDTDVLIAMLMDYMQSLEDHGVAYRANQILLATRQIKAGQNG